MSQNTPHKMVVASTDDAAVLAVLADHGQSGARAHGRPLPHWILRPGLVLLDDDDDVAALLATQPMVTAVHRHAPALPLARKFLRHHTTVKLGDIDVGGDAIAVIAGPCAIESFDDAVTLGRAVQGIGAVAMRGGVFKPRTSPWSFQGLEHSGLELLPRIRRETRLPIVTEVTSPEDVDALAEVADVLQVGARNMQNVPLLKALSRRRRPVLLKRAFGATVEELLGSAEYILAGGNDDVILCERGIRTFERHTRFTLDVAGVAWLKQHCHLPVLVDPSHAAGTPEMVIPLALAGLAAGADGLLVEVHDHPDDAKSDGDQALTLDNFKALMAAAGPLAEALGRRLPSPRA